MYFGTIKIILLYKLILVLYFNYIQTISSDSQLWFCVTTDYIGLFQSITKLLSIF